MTAPLLTFRAFQQATAALLGAESLAIFSALPAEWQSAAWRVLGQQQQARRYLDGSTELPPEWHRTRSQPLSRPRRLSREVSSCRGRDVLDTIPPPVYFEALTGEPVPASGRVSCPLPDHEDRHPSCHVYPDPGRGWYCFACGRGGTALDLAAHLTGIEPRAGGYLALRRWVAERLLSEAAA